MTLGEQAARRIEQALKMGCKPRHWIATEAAAREAGAIGAELAGLPVEIGRQRSEWGLDLVSAPRVGK